MLRCAAQVEAGAAKDKGDELRSRRGHTLWWRVWLVIEECLIRRRDAVRCKGRWWVQCINSLYVR